MASKSETGHTKNVTNFKSLNVYLDSLGVKYNPSKVSIQLPQLQAQYTAADQSLTAIQDALPAFTDAVDDQEAAFEPLDKLVTRVVRAYKACLENPAEAETVISLQKKINGKGKKADPKKEPEEGENDPISTSQLSYDNRQANFQLLVKTIGANSLYQPNEDELKVTTLQAYANDLKKATEAVDIVAAPIINGRIARNTLLYHVETGLVPATINAVKNYIISVYGAGSPQIKHINTLKFKEIKSGKRKKK